jgi:hypothetical protein
MDWKHNKLFQESFQSQQQDIRIVDINLCHNSFITDCFGADAHSKALPIP